jgi:methyltransferase (TIGR00027 family)
MDDRLDAAIARGCRQVVVLGAGLDTRAVRKQREGLVYFEIDDAESLSLKEAVCAQHGLTPALNFIAADYVRDDWLALLGEKGFAPDLQTHVIWEGNTMYPPRPAIARVLASIHDAFPFATFALDFLAPALVERRTGDAELSRLTDFLRAQARLG